MQSPAIKDKMDRARATFAEIRDIRITPKFRSDGDGASFTIISSPANAVVSRVIDRMPVILPQPLWRPWMDRQTAAADLQAILKKPFPADLMEAYPVTRDVNKRGFNGPQCIEPIVPEQTDLGMFG